MWGPRCSRRLRHLGVALAIGIVLSSCGAKHTSYRTLEVEHGGYVIPPIEQRQTGALIAARKVSGIDTLLGSGQRWQILYVGDGPTGARTTVSGQVLLPKGSAPKGGWPVVAWAHGTTGLGDQCAPSLAPRLGADDSAVYEVRALLHAKFAVVATDYPGLGTPGVHPYLIGAVNGDAVVDSVRAAHSLLPSLLSRDWAIVGHSEGGQSALFAAQHATTRAPDLHYRGVVALAPASLIEALPGLAQSDHDPVEQAYLIYALVGLGTVDPSVRIDELLAQKARAVLPDLKDGCIDQITNHLQRLHLLAVLDAPSDSLKRIATELGTRDDPDRRAVQGPILLLQGLSDTDVPAGATEHLRRNLVARGDDVTYVEYPGLDHTQLIPGSITRVVAWLNVRFAHR